MDGFALTSVLVEMDQGSTVNKVLRDMKAFEIIPEDKAGEARIFLNQIWVAGYEYYRKH